MEKTQKELVDDFIVARLRLYQDNDVADHRYSLGRLPLLEYMRSNNIERIELENGEYLQLIRDCIYWKTGKEKSQKLPPLQYDPVDDLPGF